MSDGKSGSILTPGLVVATGTALGLGVTTFLLLRKIDALDEELRQSDTKLIETIELVHALNGNSQSNQQFIKQFNEIALENKKLKRKIIENSRKYDNLRSELQDIISQVGLDQSPEIRRPSKKNRESEYSRYPGELYSESEESYDQSEESSQESLSSRRKKIKPSKKKSGKPNPRNQNKPRNSRTKPSQRKGKKKKDRSIDDMVDLM